MLLVGGVPGGGQGEKRLSAKPGLECQDMLSGKLSDQADLQGVFDGGRAADGGQHALQAGQLAQLRCNHFRTIGKARHGVHFLTVG